MKELKQTQSYFFYSIFKAKYSNLDFIKSPHAAERFNIYREIILDNLCNSLEKVFPETWKLLGKTYANKAAIAFCIEMDNLPSSASDIYWQEKFPRFLNTRKEFMELPYLADYAYFEWLRYLSSIAKTANQFDNKEFENIPDELLENIQLEFIASLFLFSSNYPLDEIKQVIDNPHIPLTQLSRNKSYIIIAKTEYSPQIFWVDKELWSFIANLKNNRLGNAVSSIRKGYNLPEAMNFILKNQLIQNIIFPN